MIDLDDMIADVRTSLELEIARERRMIAPDFAALVEAARERDPELVSEAAVLEAGEFAPIVELGAEVERRRGDGSSDELDAWIADARVAAEADVAARRLAGVPPLPSSAPAPEPRRGWATALAIAAVLASLAIAVPRLLDAFVDGNYQEAESSANQAEYVGPDAEPEDGVRVRLLQPEPSPVEPISQRAVHRSEPPPSEEPPQPAPRVRARPRRPTPVTEEASAQARDRIAALDAEAQARWAEGDLAGAEGRFREIIEIADAGHRRYADLAYGDLFTLARQRDDEAAEQALWKAYLRKFPHGRFADDARAGLCRRAATAEREACWRAYLDDFPQGVHTRTAERALGLDVPMGSP